MSSSVQSAQAEAEAQALTRTMDTTDAAKGSSVALVLAETASTIATATSAAKPSIDPLISSERRPNLSTMTTVKMVAMSCTPLTRMAAMRGPWLPSPSLAWMPAKIWGAKKVTPLTPDHCLHGHATCSADRGGHQGQGERGEGRGEHKGGLCCSAVTTELQMAFCLRLNIICFEQGTKAMNSMHRPHVHCACT